MSGRLIEIGIIRLDQRSLDLKRRNFIVGEEGFAQDLLAVFAEPGRMVPDRWRRLAPGCSGTRDAERAFGRMLDRLE